MNWSALCDHKTNFQKVNTKVYFWETSCASAKYARFNSSSLTVVWWNFYRWWPCIHCRKCCAQNRNHNYSQSKETLMNIPRNLWIFFWVFGVKSKNGVIQRALCTVVRQSGSVSRSTIAENKIWMSDLVCWSDDEKAPSIQCYHLFLQRNCTKIWTRERKSLYSLDKMRHTNVIKKNRLLLVVKCQAW